MYKLKNIVRVYGTIYRVSPVTIRFQLLPEAGLVFSPRSRTRVVGVGRGCEDTPYNGLCGEVQHQRVPIFGLLVYKMVGSISHYIIG